MHSTKSQKKTSFKIVIPKIETGKKNERYLLDDQYKLKSTKHLPASVRSPPKDLKRLSPSHRQQQLQHLQQCSTMPTENSTIFNSTMLYTPQLTERNGTLFDNYYGREGRHDQLDLEIRAKTSRQLENIYEQAFQNVLADSKYKEAQLFEKEAQAHKHQRKNEEDPVPVLPAGGKLS